MFMKNDICFAFTVWVGLFSCGSISTSKLSNTMCNPNSSIVYQTFGQ